MSIDITYKRALTMAIGLHVLLMIVLLGESSHQRPVLHKSEITASLANQEPVKAVSIDNQAVQDTMQQLKAERQHQAEVEQKQHEKILKAADTAKQERIQEQKNIEKLKDEAQKLAQQKQKQLEEDRIHLKQLALEKEKQQKQLEAMKKQQTQMEKKRLEETKKLAELKKQQTLDKIKKEKADKEAKIKLAKANAAKEAQQKAAQAQASEALAQQAAEDSRIAGEVDKYKALILSAIGRQWILPENVNPGLSSQFNIRLAPDGSVLSLSLAKTSGDPLLDRSAQAAIYKAQPLPVPKDAPTFDVFRDITLTVRPENVGG